jgi:orotate phosphoribosyltransferase-like protein
MKKVLLKTEIKLAKRLKEKEGFTNRKIARVFCVGKTTIWDAIYKNSEEMAKKHRDQHDKELRLISLSPAIVYLKNQGLNSLEVADKLEITLEEANYLFSKYR